MISNKTVTHEGLVDGAAYTFVYKGIEGSKGAGFYAEDENCLCLVGCLCLLEDCTNIRPMTMEESKFNTGDEIVRVKFFQAYAPDGYKATVLKGYCFLDAEGDTPNIVDDHWELAENTSKSQSVLDHKYIKKMLYKASLPCPRAVIDSVLTINESEIKMNGTLYPPSYSAEFTTSGQPELEMHNNTSGEQTMSNNKTVTHEGLVYQIGKNYLFGSRMRRLALTGIDSSSQFPFRVIEEDGVGNGYPRIYPSDLNAGTITPAPIELDHGKAYTFDVIGSVEDFGLVGIYNKGINRIYNLNGWNDLKNCTNIRPMSVAEGVRS